MTFPLRAAWLLLIATLVAVDGAHAADSGRVKILAALAVEPAFPEIQPLLPALAGVDADVEFAMSAAIVDRLKAGETPDLVILTKDGMAEMAKAGAVGAAADLVATEVGIAVAENAPLPVLTSADDLAAFLKAVPSIAYSRRGASGLHFAALTEQLGLAAMVKAKAVIIDEGLTARLLLAGEVAAAVQQVAELRFAGARKIVLLPDALQARTIYTVGALHRSLRKQEQAAIIAALTSSRAAEAFKRSGVHPVFAPKP